MQWMKGYYEGWAPTCRYGHSATSIGAHLVIFGGWDQSKALNETIILNDLSLLKSEEN